VDIYRNDFNIGPLGYWQAADAPDRQGITENHYIQGLYTMWDDLIRRNPGLWIDNCASGGRRIDLETLTRSLPLWRSDLQCGPGSVEPAQAHTIGLTQFVPLSATGLWAYDDYSWQSSIGPGGVFGFDAIHPIPAERIARFVKRTQDLRPYWLGDFYPIATPAADASHWVGWQLHRPDQQDGVVQLFRRAQSPYTQMQLDLRGIDPAATYTVSQTIGEKTAPLQSMPGAQLVHLIISLDSAPAETIVHYARQPSSSSK